VKVRGIQDNDTGLLNIRKELKALSGLAVKAGIVEGTGDNGGVSIAEYAAYNEYGVPGKKKKWKIPPRSFIRGWLENKDAEIKAFIEARHKMVADGKMSAKTAIKQVGEFAQGGIRMFIKEGQFTPNAERTVMIKTRGKGGSTTPLIDTGTMRNSVRYEVISK
jgi:hypothetical protein